MRKILTKTITSILICLSLAFSSISFLPMSAFATTDDAFMENSPVNLEFKADCNPPPTLN